MRQVSFLVPPEVVMLDLAGPLQVFAEAAASCANLRPVVSAFEPGATRDAGIRLAGLAPHPDPWPRDLVVPGARLIAHGPGNTRAGEWLARAGAGGAEVSSVCTDAIVPSRALSRRTRRARAPGEIEAGAVGEDRKAGARAVPCPACGHQPKSI